MLDILAAQEQLDEVNDPYIVVQNESADDIVFVQDGREFIFIGTSGPNADHEGRPTLTHIMASVGRPAMAAHPELVEMQLVDGEYVPLA